MTTTAEHTGGGTPARPAIGIPNDTGRHHGPMTRLRHATAAEWTKLWSLRSTWWCLAGTAALMALTSATVGASTASNRVSNGDPTTVNPTSAAVSATSIAQFALVALAMLAICSEYTSGGIRSTLQAVPVRGRVLAAKALVLAPVMFGAGVVLGAASAAGTYALLTNDAFGGLAHVDWADSAYDVVAIGGYFALVALLTLGIGAALRSAAGTLTVAFMLLMGVPLVLVMTGNQVAVDVSMRMPMFAGLAFMRSTDNITGGPIGYPAWQGLAWLAAWTVIGAAAGYAVLRERDA